MLQNVFLLSGGEVVGIVHSFTYELLKKALDLSEMRHKVIANNIANVNTKGFKSAKVEFADALKRAVEDYRGMGQPQQRVVGGRLVGEVQPTFILQNNHTLKNDGNDVDIDGEMAALVENQLYYNALIRQINEKIKNLHYVISEGRR